MKFTIILLFDDNTLKYEFEFPYYSIYSLTIMLTDEEMPILVDIHLIVKGVRRVDVNTYTELQTGTEVPDYTVRECSVSCTLNCLSTVSLSKPANDSKMVYFRK